MKKASQTSAPRPGYRDLAFRLVISFPAAIYITLFGENANFFEAVFHLNFWIAVAFSYLVSLLLLWAINRISYALDERYSWRRETVVRLSWQFSLGVIAPALLTFGLTTLYFLAFGLNILDTDYLKYDFPVVVQLIIMANIYYLVYFLWIVPPDSYLRKGYAVWEEEGKSKGLFLAHIYEKILAVLQEDIAAIHTQEGHSLLVKFDRETIAIQQSLTLATEELDSTLFFRINKQYVVNYRLCREYKKENGRLFITLGAPLNSTQEVPRRKIKEFELWLKR